MAWICLRMSIIIAHGLCFEGTNERDRHHLTTLGYITGIKVGFTLATCCFHGLVLSSSTHTYLFNKLILPRNIPRQGRVCRDKKLLDLSETFCWGRSVSSGQHTVDTVLGHVSSKLQDQDNVSDMDVSTADLCFLR